MNKASDLVVNEKINYFLKHGGTDQWASSAVATERGVTYLKYDAIRIGNAQDGSKGVSLQFILSGVPVAWTRIYKAEMNGVAYHTTQKIEGRLKISG